MATGGARWKAGAGACWLILCVATVAMPAAARTRGKADLLSQAKRAASLGDLSEAGPYHLELTFKLYGAHHQTLEGTYRTTWYSEKLWRSDLASPIYSKLAVGTQKGVWNEARPEYMPYAVSQAEAYLFGWSTNLDPSEKLTHPHNMKVDGRRLLCARAKGKRDGTLEFCFDRRTRKLAVVRRSRGDELLEYSRYTAWKARLVPQLIRASKQGKPEMEARVQKIGPAPQGGAAALVPLSGPLAIHLPVCKTSNIVPAKKLIGKNPPYPLIAQSSGEEGKIRIHAIVGRDGLLHQVTILQTVAPDLERRTLETLKHWRYRPCTCGGVPVSVPTEIDVKFSLHGR